MSKKIFLAQSVEELKFILEKVPASTVCVPLSLHTQLYCIKNKLHFYNALNFINKKFYEKGLLESENLTNKLNFGSLTNESHIKEYTAIIRSRFFSTIFLNELIEKISRQEKIEEIFVSGWNSYSSRNQTKNHFISYLTENLFLDKRITKLSVSDSDREKFSPRMQKDYIILNKNLSAEKNYILINNIGYNFKRIILTLFKKNYYILVPEFDKFFGRSKISFFKKKILSLFKVIIIEFDSKPKKEQKKFSIPDIDFSYEGKNLSKILNYRKEQELGNLIKLKNIYEGIDVLFDKIVIKLVLVNIMRGIGGYYLEKSKEKNIPSVSIPHGTLSENFDNYDKIFKKMMSDAQINKNARCLAVQSKIAKDFVKAFNIEQDCIESGNLIFGEVTNVKRKKIVYAVTLKEFTSIRYSGIEMYHEFLDNLYFLDDCAKKNNIKILIKLHSSANHCFKDLKEIFKNLEFTKKKIDHILKYSLVTISFSSTVIEDSLYSGVPVILLDRWKRYKHCKAQENVKKKNSAVYYVTNENDLIECINTIKKSDQISFKEYIFEGNAKLNIKKLMQRFLHI